MAENSGIAWTNHTHNHWIGCTKVSPGCDHCYAEAWNRRFDGGANWGVGAPRRLTSQQNRNKPLRWQREAGVSGIRPRVFCASLADVFDNEVSDGWRADLFNLIERTPKLDWILVTKRVGNVRKMKPDGGFSRNVILLATIVDQVEADRDMPKLVAAKMTGAVQHIGVSYEPALGPVNWSPWIADVDWIIVGGESAQGGAPARPFDAEWARATVAQCRDAHVPVFVKQMGANVRDRNDTGFDGCGESEWNLADEIDQVEHDINGYREEYQGAPVRIRLRDRAGADPIEWPADLRVRQFPVIGGAPRCNIDEMEEGKQRESAQ